MPCANTVGECCGEVIITATTVGGHLHFPVDGGYGAVLQADMSAYQAAFISIVAAIPFDGGAFNWYLPNRNNYDDLCGGGPGLPITTANIVASNAFPPPPSLPAEGRGAISFAYYGRDSIDYYYARTRYRFSSPVYWCLRTRTRVSTKIDNTIYPICSPINDTRVETDVTTHSAGLGPVSELIVAAAGNPPAIGGTCDECIGANNNSFTASVLIISPTPFTTGPCANP